MDFKGIMVISTASFGTPCTCVVLVSAGEDAGPAGAADGCGGEGVPELRALVRDQPPRGLQRRGAAHSDVLVSAPKRSFRSKSEGS